MDSSGDGAGDLVVSMFTIMELEVKGSRRGVVLGGTKGDEYVEVRVTIGMEFVADSDVGRRESFTEMFEDFFFSEVTLRVR